MKRGLGCIVQLLFWFFVISLACGTVSGLLPGVVTAVLRLIPDGYGEQLIPFFLSLGEDTMNLFSLFFAAIPDTPGEVNNITALGKSASTLGESLFLDTGFYVFLAVAIVGLVILFNNPKQLWFKATRAFFGLFDRKFTASDLLVIGTGIFLLFFGLFVYNYGALDFISESLPALFIIGSLILVRVFWKDLSDWLMKGVYVLLCGLLALVVIGIFIGMNNSTEAFFSFTQTSEWIATISSPVEFGILLSATLTQPTLLLLFAAVAGFLWYGGRNTWGKRVTGNGNSGREVHHA